jgi:hypothetical protein
MSDIIFRCKKCNAEFMSLESLERHQITSITILPQEVIRRMFPDCHLQPVDRKEAIRI